MKAFLRIKVKTAIWLVLSFFIAGIICGVSEMDPVILLGSLGAFILFGLFFLWAAYRFDVKAFFYDGRFFIIGSVVLGVVVACANR